MKKPGNTKHGMTDHPIHNAWLNMKQRCYNFKFKQYKDYGGRGIKICDRWLESFENFYEDMGSTWKPGLTLDRINNDGNYELGNCRWITRKEQLLNRRAYGAVPFKGVSWDKRDEKFRAKAWINGKYKYLGLFETAEEASLAYQKAILG